MTAKIIEFKKKKQTEQDLIFEEIASEAKNILSFEDKKKKQEQARREKNQQVLKSYRIK